MACPELITTIYEFTHVGLPAIEIKLTLARSTQNMAVVSLALTAFAGQEVLGGAEVRRGKRWFRGILESEGTGVTPDELAHGGDESLRRVLVQRQDLRRVAGSKLSAERG